MVKNDDIRMVVVIIVLLIEIRIFFDLYVFIWRLFMGRYIEMNWFLFIVLMVLSFFMLDGMYLGYEIVWY